MRQTTPGGGLVGAAVLVSALVTVPVTLLAPPAHASDSEDQSARLNESVTAYHTTAEVHPDGTVDVVEAITYDFDTNTSPGIYRSIPVTLDKGLFRERVVEIRDLEVSSPTGAETRLDSAGMEGDEYVVLVGLEGLEDTHVTGEHTYELSYTLEGALLALDDHDEFYWDFVGPDWDVPKEDVSVQVTAPRIIDVSCYQGAEHGNSPCEQAEYSGEIARAGQSRLAATDGMTVAVSMAKGAVDTSASSHETRRMWTIGLTVPVLALLLLGAVALMAVYRKRTDAAARAGFDRIPPGLGPAAAHTMRSSAGTLGPEDLMIMLVQLEERGLIASQPHPGTPGDWVFHLRVHPNDPRLTPAEQVLVRDLFAGAPSTDLQMMTTSLTPSVAQAVNKRLYEEKRALNLCPTSGTYLFGRVLLPLLCVIAGVIVLFAGDSFPARGAVYVAFLLFGYAVASGVLLGMGPYNANGRRVRALLEDSREDSVRGGPLSVIGSPSWELAVGLPSQVQDRLAYDYQMRTHQPRPYFYDPVYRRRWDQDCGRRMQPQSSGGGGFSSGGGSGGGSVGGGGGGGGGGSR
ncbi:DUF2207 domain-containing protein [Nocardiopsis metallicus]|uniref:Putative membrane protein YgcG n=1 Tax=Nocardiopsis metallicus TaxID=179819 RepID=A0A840WEQ8_9ACTN|nr:DUF2207 domain-containing protein [Nocardiopsis metallicus]MBB5493893.1 putative membrane protein YgcG [Nocardiopsis metallicus]